jgi:hypothetical protein
MLVLGLFAEGRTDESFLPIIIQRTAKELLSLHGHPEIDVLLPNVMSKPSSTSILEECILHAAHEAYGHHALIVHSDADDRGYKQTLVERFHPGYERVQRARISENNVCEHLVPIIPVRMLEAWMLADSDALCHMMGTKVKKQASKLPAILGIPAKAKLVESETDPKDTLNNAIKRAYPGQSRVWGSIRGRLYEELAFKISLDRLYQVPSYQQFTHDLTTALKILNLI